MMLKYLSMFGSSSPPVVCMRAHVLFKLCLYAYSGVQLIFCFVFLRLVYPILPVSLDCPLLIAPLRYSLTFISYPSISILIEQDVLNFLLVKSGAYQYYRSNLLYISDIFQQNILHYQDKYYQSHTIQHMGKLDYNDWILLILPWKFKLRNVFVFPYFSYV
jgi:hypothetical protein